MVKNKQKMGRVVPESQKQKKKIKRKFDATKVKPVDIATLYGLTPVGQTSSSGSASWETESEPTTPNKPVPKNAFKSDTTPRRDKKKLLKAPPPFVVDLDDSSDQSFQQLNDSTGQKKERFSGALSEKKKKKTVEKRNNYVTPINFDSSSDDSGKIPSQTGEVPELPEVPSTSYNMIKPKKKKRNNDSAQVASYIPSKQFEEVINETLQSAEILEVPDVPKVIDKSQLLKKKNKRKQSDLVSDILNDEIPGETSFEESSADRKKLRRENAQESAQKLGPKLTHHEKSPQKKKNRKNNSPSAAVCIPSVDFDELMDEDQQSYEIPEVPDVCVMPQDEGKDSQKKKKQKKQRNSVDDGAKICSDFYLVPWVDENEWTSVCNLLQKKDFAKVTEHVDIWRERVPSLPVGVEATAVLIRALDFERNNTKSGDELRSLFSLAVVRFLNLVSNLSAKEVSAGHVAMVQMAKHLDVPDWIVSIRHEVSHGAVLPSVEFLHMAATTILDWLLKYYWTGSYECDYLLMDAGSTNILFARARKEKEQEAEDELSEEWIMEQIRSSISSLVACKIYRMRGNMTITDEDILKTIFEEEEKSPQFISTKAAMGRLTMKFTALWDKGATLVAKAIGDQLVFPEEFLKTFAEVFSLDLKTQEGHVFTKCKQAWSPVFAVTKSKKEKYPLICQALTSHLEQEELPTFVKALAGRWLSFVIREIPKEASYLHEQRIKPLVEVMETVMMKRDLVPDDTMTRLLNMMTPALGQEKCELLKELDSIFCVDDTTDEATPKKFKRSSNFHPFTVEEITGEPAVDVMSQASLNHPKALPGPKAADIQNWSVDPKGSHYWRQIPIGAVSK